MSTEIRFDPSPEPAVANAPAKPNYPVTDQVSVTAVATKIVDRRPGRGSVTIKNLDGANTLYIGNENVTSSNGEPLAPGEGQTLRTEDSVYGICSGGQTATASYLEDQP